MHSGSTTYSISASFVARFTGLLSYSFHLFPALFHPPTEPIVPATQPPARLRSDDISINSGDGSNR